MTKDELAQMVTRNPGNVDMMMLVDYVEFLHKFLELKSEQMEQVIAALQRRGYEFE